MPSAIIALAVASAFEISAGTIAYAAIAAASALITSVLVSKIFAPNTPDPYAGGAGSQSDPGVASRLTVSPENKIGVGYGSFWVKGAEIHGENTADYKTAYYVIALSEAITGSANTLTSVYWQEFALTLGSDGWVTGAVDASGASVSDFNNNVRVQFFASGLPVDRSSLPNTSWFTNTGNLVSGYSIAVVTLNYNRDKQLFTLLDMTFNLTNTLTAPGSVLLDYLTNARYGGGLTTSFVDATSLAALDTYSNQLVPYTDPTTGSTVMAKRYTINGIINTNQDCWNNAEELCRCAGSNIKVNNANGKFAVFIDKPDTSVFDFDAFSIVGKSTITRADLTSTPNQLVTNFADGSVQFKGKSNTFTYKTPLGLVPATAPTIQNQISYSLVNNSVQAMRLAALETNQWQLDLSYQFNSDHRALGLSAGDVITVTDSFNGWSQKLFRIASIAETEGSDGAIVVEIATKEYSADIYSNTVIAYNPAPNVSTPSSRAIANYQPIAPIVSNLDINGAVPTFNLLLTIPSAARVDRLQVYYSANTTDQGSLYADIPANNASGYFAPGTFIVTGSGLNSNALQVQLNAGNYYFTTKYYNENIASNLSAPSNVLQFLPIRQQFQLQYLIVRYGTSSTGANYSISQTGATYLGLLNSPTTSAPITPSSYTWYPVGGTASSANRIYFNILGNRQITFRLATSNPDITQWTDLFVPPDPTNPILDLDALTGFFVRSVYTAGGGSFLNSVANADGTVTFLLPPGTSVPGTTPLTSIASLTVDTEGRLAGFTAVDKIYFFQSVTIATSVNQTFSFTHVLGQALVFMNGLLLDTTDFSETTTNITIPNSYSGAVVNLIRFTQSNSAGTTAYVPFTRANVNTVAGQAQYTTTFDQGAELLFINGVFIHDQDYSYPTTNSFLLGWTPLVSNNLITIIAFRRFNTAQTSFGQAVGNTTAAVTAVALSGYSNINYSITSKNGMMIANPNDVTTTTTQATLVAAPIYTGESIEVTAWLASGAAVAGASGASRASDTLSDAGAASLNDFPYIPPMPTLAEQLQDLQNQINELKGL